MVLAYGHRLYHLDSYRADYGAADEIGPVLQMFTLWSWTTLLALSAVRADHVPVSQVALFWAVTFLLLVVLRSAARAFAARQGVVPAERGDVGPVSQASPILQKILRRPEWGIGLRSTGQEALPGPHRRALAQPRTGFAGTPTWFSW